MKWMIDVDRLNKNFFLHTQGEAKIPVFRDFHMKLKPGESIALVGPSGVGKSTLLRLLYGNYKTGSGKILVHHNGEVLNMAGADPHMILHIRKWTIGYVSQFLRVIPRVPAIQVVMEPLKVRSVSEKEARPRAEELLTRLRIPKRLWSLSPTTFSGGEKQRINIARAEKGQVSLDDFNILWKSDLIPGSPMCVRGDLPESLKAAFCGALMMFNNDKMGLQKLQIGGYAACDDSTYDTIRYLKKLKAELKAGQ